MPKKSENRTHEIIDFIMIHPKCTSLEILEGLNLDMSVATLRRKLQTLVAADLINAIGELKSRKYEISNGFEIIRPIDMNQYFEKEIDDRVIQDKFNSGLINDTLQNISIFTNTELDHLKKLQETFTSNLSKLTRSEYKKELERLAIDLSWKSSQIEGNTYSLLETEKLLKEKFFVIGRGRGGAAILCDSPPKQEVGVT